MFQRVVLPPTVADELAHPPPVYQKVEVSLWFYLEVRPPENASRVAELRVELDAGEAEAIALAEELGAELVLVDELAGRTVARRCGFTPLGTLGLLVRAKQRGLCPAVAPLLDRLQGELNFFLSTDLRRRVLAQAGE
jgi:predicted nucleic acid-binding protein